MESELKIKSISEVMCPNCGAQISLAPDKVHGLCVFCKALYLLSEEETDIIKEKEIASKSLNPQYLKNISEICGSHRTFADYLYVSSSMKNSLLYRRKLKKVKEYFHIPEEDDGFLIYNAAVLKTFSLGFALCTSGFYYGENDRHTIGKLTWAEFRETKIIASGKDVLMVGNLYFETFFCARELEKLLKRIQQSI